MAKVTRSKIGVWAAIVAAVLLLFASTSIHAVPVATRASASGGQSATAALTINKPAGTTTGDVMVASIGYRPCSSTSGGGCTTSITAPAGWTLVRLVEQKTGGGTGGYGLRLAIYRKVVTAAESSISNYTWTFGGAPTHNGAAGVISSFMNVDTTNPIVIDAGQATPSSRSHSTPDIGVLATNTMLVSTHAALSSATWTPPAGMTEILDWASQAVPDDLGMSLEINNEQRPTAGATGIRTATFSNPPAADAGATHILALRPIQADPTITMGRTSPAGGNLIVGSTASYTLTIGNNGPQGISAANITVTDTLPAGLTFTSGTGTNWSCTAAGQVVTCTYSGAALANGATLPVLSVNVNVVSGTAWTNTATVTSGADGDNDLTNSTATDTWPTVTTTITTGTDPAAVTIAPSAPATDVNAFTLKTSVSGTTEPISAVTVNLSSNLGVDTLSITDSTGATVYGSVALPASGNVTIPVIGLTANFTLTTYKVRITPLAHVSMPVPPGGTYIINAPVTGWTGPAAHLGTDSDNVALTIDNLSPNSATATSGTAGTQNVTLKWTTSSSADFDTSNGSVIYRWAGAAGSEVPIEGSSPLIGQTNGTATVACVVSSAASTALTRVDGSGGTAGACTTAALVSGQAYTYKVFQQDANGNFDVGVVIGTFGNTNPGSFNAFETGTAANSITGVIKTKVAGTTYSLDIVAINGGAQMASFSGTVAVELVANANTGVALGAGNCPTSGTTLAVGTAAIASGRSTISFPAVANSWRDVRVRVSYPTASPTVVTCSNDNFAVRPSFFAVAVTDTDWSSAGLTRALNNVAATGAGNVHKAGSPTTLTITAYNGAATPAITTNYTLTPTVSISSYLTPATCTTCTFTTGTLAGAAGTVASNTASYNEVGTFVLQAQDTAYASVDASDSSNAERYVTGTVNVGRFVPDHFDVTVNQNGAMQTACGAGFTYTGQAMTYQAASLPSLTIKPMNAAASGSVTQNYIGSLQKLTAGGITITAPTADTTANGLDGATRMALGAAMTTGTLTNSSGTMTYTLKSSDTFTYTRNANALVAPFTSDIRLITAAVAEPAEDGVTAVVASLPTLKPTGVEVRYGRVHVLNAYGSELLDLPMTLRAEYWISGGWRLNSADTCTDATLSFAAVGTDITGNTCVLEPGNNSAKGCAVALTAAQANRKYLETGVAGTDSNGVAGFAGNFNLWLRAPGATHAGSLDVTATVPTWLQFNWTGTVGNPRGRATFGAFKSPLIYRRENY